METLIGAALFAAGWLIVGICLARLLLMTRKPTKQELAAYRAIRRRLLYENIRAAYLMAKCRAITARLAEKKEAA